VLLQHPYDSFSTSVQAFIEQAAADPRVLAIKQTLYRTSGDSPIIDALIDAAEAGKQVLAVVEIKARFDEQNNISWARKLEHAGVHVVYGIVGLKTHCKLCLVVRQEAEGLRRYCHVGTGNYNPKTARLYEDLGLLTATRGRRGPHPLFNQLSGMPRAAGSSACSWPRGRCAGADRADRRRDRAAERRSRRRDHRLKVNSIVDEAMIDALYRASQAGVPVDCGSAASAPCGPGVPGLSDNIGCARSWAASSSTRASSGSAAAATRGLDRQRRHDAPQPRPPRRGAGARLAQRRDPHVPRHALATPRSAWKGDDRRRPLSPAGHVQVPLITDTLAAYGVEALTTSPSTRCVQTLAGYAKRSGLDPHMRNAISEEGFAKRGAKRVYRVVDEVLATGVPTAVCSHGPVLPTILEALVGRLAPVDELIPGADTSLAEAADLGIEKGEVFIAHVCGVGDAARIIAVERITSKAEV
jgi:phosphohistidine phosphatase SixA